MKKFLFIILAALVLICAGESILKTIEANKERDKRLAEGKE